MYAGKTENMAEKAIKGLSHFSCIGYFIHHIKSMQYMWLPSMTLCMSMLSNTTLDPRSRMNPPLPTPVPKSPISYTTYLNAAMMLIKAAMPIGNNPS
ncbi:hypothetical protein CEXT_574841 [Caerostris extrusa]|uniref:Uncharacterized protein n=1 Tax=Caerostris extrusa TaxID=172846 RepID=A0AAV4Y6L6_CAEEX|nr:hypothetical protein CEXT_574841 [Caerostris extrusa]